MNLDDLDRLAEEMPTGAVTVVEREEWDDRLGYRPLYDLCVARYPFATFKTREEAAFHAACDPATVRALVAVARAQGEMLRRLEWSGYESGDVRHWHCPICGNWQDDGHAPDCKLAALLAALPGATDEGVNE